MLCTARSRCSGALYQPSRQHYVSRFGKHFYHVHRPVDLLANSPLVRHARSSSLATSSSLHQEQQQKDELQNNHQSTSASSAAADNQVAATPNGVAGRATENGNGKAIQVQSDESSRAQLHNWLTGSVDESAADTASFAPAAQASTAGATKQQATTSQPQSQPAAPKQGNFINRVIFGVLLGVGGGFVVLFGQWAFLAAIVFATYQSTQEYYSMVTSKGITKGMAPPPPLVSSLTTVLCVSIALLSYFFKGKSGTILAVSAFFLLVMNMVAIKKPKFSMLASTVFGLFYCGWLPSFWLKLRMLPFPAPDIAALPAILAPLTSWTVGLLATFTSVACIVAADTGAYFVGKSLGRTKLTEISPKKTVEGAVGGLASSIAVALAMWKTTSWPPTPLAATGLGVIVFFSSLFGDLIESIIKRDAEMKDSGDLIPGHGGLLDRIDSYMFTGAVSYFFVVFVLPWLAG